MDVTKRLPIFKEGYEAFAERGRGEVTSDDASLTGIHLRRAQNAFRPISRLPPEILSDILLFASSPHPLSKMMSYESFQVCHIWRECGLQAPRIWTTLRFPKSPNLVKGFVDEVLPRSKALALDLTIPIEDPSTTEHIRLVIRSVSFRLHDLRIYLSHPRGPSLFPLLGTFSILRSFAFELRAGSMRFQPSRHLFDSGSVASIPELQDLHIVAEDFEFSVNRDLNAPKLGRLDIIAAAPGYKWNALLTHGPLRSLKWNMRIPNMLKNPPPSTLPHLTTLITSMWSFATFFAPIELPFLRHLEIIPHLTEHRLVPEPGDLAELAEASGHLTSLRYLAIRDPDIILSEKLLRHLPALEELRVLAEVTVKTPDIFHLLRGGGANSTTPCPKLARLTVAASELRKSGETGEDLS